MTILLTPFMSCTAKLPIYAFSVILLATIVIWFLQSFDFHLNIVELSEDSIFAMPSVSAAALLVNVIGSML